MTGVNGQMPKHPHEIIEEELSSLQEHMMTLVTEAAQHAREWRLEELVTTHEAIAKTREAYNMILETREVLLQNHKTVLPVGRDATTPSHASTAIQPADTAGTEASLQHASLHVDDLQEKAVTSSHTEQSLARHESDWRMGYTVLGGNEERSFRIPPNLPKFRETGYEKAETFIDQVDFPV